MMQAVGFEPTHVAISDLESDPLDHSGTLASRVICPLSATRTHTDSIIFFVVHQSSSPYPFQVSLSYSKP